MRRGSVASLPEVRFGSEFKPFIRSQEASSLVALNRFKESVCAKTNNWLESKLHETVTKWGTDARCSRVKFYECLPGAFISLLLSSRWSVILPCIKSLSLLDCASQEVTDYGVRSGWTWLLRRPHFAVSCSDVSVENEPVQGGGYFKRMMGARPSLGAIFVCVCVKQYKAEGYDNLWSVH